jgi:hypothetical protein
MSASNRSNSETEIQAFVEMRAGMTKGWSEAFDKLDEYLGQN